MGHEENILKVIIAGTLLIIFLGTCVVFFVLMYKNRQRKFRLEKVQMEQHFQREILKTQLEIQEQTLKNISQEIHDNIGQTLSLAKLNLNTIKLEHQVKALEKVAASKDLVGKAITDLRILSKTLHTDSVLHEGLLKALELELCMIEKGADKTTLLNIEGTPVRIDAQKELILFRTVQEALNNALKHADATTITVNINYKNADMELVIEDNGKGINTEKKSEDIAGGSGLRNMQNRVELIGGKLITKNSKTGGTIIHIHLPNENI